MIAVLIAIAIQPSFDKDKVSDERRNLALQDGGVSSNDVLILGTGLIELIDNCVEENRKIYSKWEMIQIINTVSKGKREENFFQLIHGANPNRSLPTESSPSRPRRSTIRRERNPTQTTEWNTSEWPNCHGLRIRSESPAGSAG